MRHWWREKGVPLLWMTAAAVVLSVALGHSIARAEPFTPGQDYADAHAADICGALDAEPTVRAVWQLLIELTTTGLSGVEAGVAVKESVIYVCPHHIPLVKRFAAYYQQHPTGAFA